MNYDVDDAENVERRKKEKKRRGKEESKKENMGRRDSRGGEGVYNGNERENLVHGSGMQRLPAADQWISVWGRLTYSHPRIQQEDLPQSVRFDFLSFEFIFVSLL